MEQDKESQYKTILVIVSGFLVFYLLFKLKVLVLIAAGLGILALAIPLLRRLIVLGWYKLAEGLGWVNSRILLSVIFFLILFPIAFLFRLFNKDPLHLKKKSGSVFDKRNHQYTPEDLANIW